MGVGIKEGIGSFREWAIRVAIEQHNSDWAMPVQLENGKVGFACTIEAYNYYRGHCGAVLPVAKSVEELFGIMSSYPKLGKRLKVHEYAEKKVLLFYTKEKKISPRRVKLGPLIHLGY